MVDNRYANALHNAAHKCDVEALRRCLTPEALAACPIDARDRDNHTVLHALCRYTGPGYDPSRRVDDRNAEIWYSSDTTGILWYLHRVLIANGFNKLAQAHLATLTNTFEPKFTVLPKELVRHVVSFWLHAGYY